jgi:hypothetical protein
MRVRNRLVLLSPPANDLGASHLDRSAWAHGDEPFLPPLSNDPGARHLDRSARARGDGFLLPPPATFGPLDPSAYEAM